MLGIWLAVGATLASGTASGATIAPNTLADESGTGGACSLREALQAANTDAPFGGCPTGAGADTIPLAAGTYSLTIPLDASPDDNLDGDLDVTAGSVVEIAHSGLAPTAISGTPAANDRVFDVPVTSASATLSGLTIRGGNAATFGGGIQNRGVLSLSNSTVTGNSSATNAGGFNITGTSVTNLSNVTISGNTANGGGAGFNLNAGTATLTNVTVTGNTADADATGGEGGGLFRFAGTLTLRNTIVAGNADLTPGDSDPDCSGTVASAGNNLVGNTAGCDLVSAAGDLLNVNPLLGPLGDNGGSTQTHALLTGSPAIDGGGAGGPATDQRGAPRNPDIGAYELVRCAGRVVNRVGTSGGDRVTGTSGADGFLLGPGKDRGVGGKGKDSICGEGGKDTLNGGTGKDRLIGGRGRDKLNGGKGRDTCKGGKGDDTGSNCEVEKSTS